ncbi:MAG: dihydrofolate reductase [Erysipelotrichaceae bacterium]|nr:dihydrofolate reductase [Erysipelotrichaceae bacterium]
MFSLIVAHDEGLGIGNKGIIPWNLKEDLKHFRNMTIHKRIVMGRVTFEGFKKPLPERHTIVICSPGKEKEDSEMVSYVTDFKKFLEENKDTDEEIMICGGGLVYKAALPYCKKMYISLVEGKHEADAFFPEYDVNDYDVLSVTPYEGFKVIEYQKKA